MSWGFKPGFLPGSIVRTEVRRYLRDLDDNNSKYGDSDVNYLAWSL
jgi:phosphate starvation-inducible protein PhoH